MAVDKLHIQLPIAFSWAGLTEVALATRRRPANQTQCLRVSAQGYKLSLELCGARDSALKNTSYSLEVCGTGDSTALKNKGYSLEVCVKGGLCIKK